MTDKERNRIVEKIRKLMAMAERSKGNENEAANAASQVEKMLRKYNLTFSDITPEEAKSNITDEIADEYKWTPGRAPTWVNGLSVAVAEACEAYVMWTPAKSGNDSHVRKTQMNLRFIGQEVDVKTAILMFDYLYKTIIRLSDEWGKTAFIPKGKARTYKNSYRSGMSSRLAERLREMTAEKEEEYRAAGTAMVVVKKDAISEHLGRKAAYGRSNRQTTTDYGAYGAGYTKANSIGLNRQIT